MGEYRMKWIKKGLIFNVDKDHGWMWTHSQIPTLDKLENRLRIYFATRNSENKTHTGVIEVEADNPKEVLHVPSEPILSPGEQGTFDDCGTMPSWIVTNGNKKFLDRKSVV